MIRVLSLIFLAWGLIYGLANVRDEIRGETFVYAPKMARSSADGQPYHENKLKHPEAFRNAMTHQWIMASILLGLGFAGEALRRRQDRLDPFSSSFDYPDPVDDHDRKA
jgi:hypothetical protein